MARYVDRDIVLQIIDSYAKTVTEDGKVIVDAVRDIVSVITPTADVVEVVRCEKCKYRTEVTECNHTLYFCRKKQNYIKLNDFCSYGERKKVE